MAKHEQQAYERLGAKVLTLPDVIAQSGAIVSRYARRRTRAGSRYVALAAVAGAGPWIPGEGAAPSSRVVRAPSPHHGVERWAGLGLAGQEGV